MVHSIEYTIGLRIQLHGLFRVNLCVSDSNFCLSAFRFLSGLIALDPDRSGEVFFNLTTFLPPGVATFFDASPFVGIEDTFAQANVLRRGLDEFIAVDVFDRPL